ncbi:hypothetical protein PVK06_028068 [Gossypium arboreum]|uniref:Uncharacterized protein n=1 Tax=Gossypium arboreum TaxID=29729 RepID=A0ABR0P2G3_GOSAR|nr:hypothetical protein PVK06_028068 [Gossypium arboreum]
MSTGYNILTGDYSKISKTNIDLSAPTQEANELPCNGSTTFQHPLLLQFTSTCFLIILINVFGGLDYEECVSPLMEAEAVDLVKTVFASASEEISTLFVLFVIVLVIGYLQKAVFSILEPQY